MLNLTSEIRYQYLSQGRGYVTMYELRELIKIHGFNEKKLLGRSSMNKKEDTHFFHIEECSEGPSKATEIWKAMVDIRRTCNEVYIGGEIMWWGEDDKERFPLPMTKFIPYNFDVNKHNDILLTPPTKQIELCRVEKSFIISLGCMRKCDDLWCERQCDSAIAKYDENGNISYIVLTCNTHLLIPLCSHYNMNFLLYPDEKVRIFFDFSFNRWRGILLHHLIKNTEIILSEDRSLIKVERNVEEDIFDNILSLNTISECKIIKALYVIYNKNSNHTMASMITLSQSKSPCVKVVCSQSLRLLLENMSGGVGGFDSNIQPPKEIYKNMVGEIIVGATTCKCERHYNTVPTNKKPTSWIKRTWSRITRYCTN